MNQEVPPSPQTTLVILLGASEWPKWTDLGSSETYANSAQGVEDYFLDSQRFSLPQENLLNLFDSDESADDIDEEIRKFLTARITEMRSSNQPARDVLIFFIGHGGFADESQDYYLAIRRIKKDNPTVSGLRIIELAKTVKECARHLRRILILDCCYAATAFNAFQTQGRGPEEAAMRQTMEAFRGAPRPQVGTPYREWPSKGTTLLCSSSRGAQSILGERYTEFSGALLHILNTGSVSKSEKMSIHMIVDLIRDLFVERKSNAPRPEVHSPDQCEGDIAHIPLFPNRALPVSQALPQRDIVHKEPSQLSFSDEATDEPSISALLPSQPTIEKPEGKTDEKRDRDHYFDKFTERARKVLALAEVEAQRLQHNYIGTEHLLLGLVREGEGVAAKVLSNFGVDLNTVRSAVEFIIGSGERIVLGEIGLTPRAKKVIELAVDEARRLNHHYIGTEHLLLGLLREGEGIATGVLESIGANLEKVRAQTIQVMSQSGAFRKRNVQRSKTPIINQIGGDLTDDALMGKLDPIIGRHQEVEHIIRILCRRNKNNPVLIGQPGVGKTTIVKGLAQHIVGGAVPGSIVGKRLVTLDLGILPRTLKKWGGEMEQQLEKIVEELHVDNGCILFLDDLPRLFGVNTTERMLDVAQLFKLALSRGELQCLGTSTPEAYDTMTKQDVALQAWFEKIPVGAMTIEETLEVLKAIREEYEQHHRLTIADEALKAAAELASSSYISDYSLPGKAIALLDAAASHVSTQQAQIPSSLKEALKDLESILREKEHAMQQQEYESAAELRDREVKLRDCIAKLDAGWQRDRGIGKPTVDEEAVAQVVSEKL